MNNLLKVIVTIALASGAASVSAQTSVLSEQLTAVEVGTEKPNIRLSDSGKLDVVVTANKTKVRLSDSGKLDVVVTANKTKVRL